MKIVSWVLSLAVFISPLNAATIRDATGSRIRPPTSVALQAVSAPSAFDREIGAPNGAFIHDVLPEFKQSIDEPSPPGSPYAGKRPALADHANNGPPGDLQSLLWSYWAALKTHARVPGHGKAVSIASAGILSDVLHAANPDQIVLIDRNVYEGRNLYSFERKDFFRRREKYANLSTGDAEALGMRPILLYDLRQIGVNKETIDYKGLDHGAHVYQFPWAFPGDDPAMRTVYVYPEWPILLALDLVFQNESDLASFVYAAERQVPFHARGAKIFFQKASMDMPAAYASYVAFFIYFMAMGPLWFVTDDSAYSGPDGKQYYPLGTVLSPSGFSFESVHTHHSPIATLQAMRDHLSTRIYKAGYGWDLQVWRLNRRPDAFMRIFNTPGFPRDASGRALSHVGSAA